MADNRQPRLPGLVPEPSQPLRPAAPRSLRASHQRVRSDPAVLEGEARGQERSDDWRAAFAEFLRRLPEERREQLRGRLRRGGTRRS